MPPRDQSPFDRTEALKDVRQLGLAELGEASLDAVALYIGWREAIAIMGRGPPEPRQARFHVRNVSVAK
jgi:hypothetical protein